MSTSLTIHLNIRYNTLSRQKKKHKMESPTSWLAGHLHEEVPEEEECVLVHIEPNRAEGEAHVTLLRGYSGIRTAAEGLQEDL